MSRSSTTYKKGEHSSPKTEFPKGQIPWNRGLKEVYKQTPETREKVRLGHLGKRYNEGKHWETKICKKCREPFEVHKGAGRKRVYCSRTCSGLDRKSQGFINQQGYKIVRRDCKSIFEHRLVAEEMAGRSLRKGEVVHHINGIKNDNREENLLVMTQSGHKALTDHLANLWMVEHPNEVDRVSRAFQITFSSGG